MINAAYSLEKGVAGVGFKREGVERYPRMEQLEQDIAAAAAGTDEAFFVVASPPREGGAGAGECEACSSTHGASAPLGCVRVQPLVRAEGCRRIFEFGPYAVNPQAQGRGVGKALLAMAEDFARQRGAVALQIDVVNHRSDLFPYYSRRGFVQVGTRPFYSNCDLERDITRPTHFVTMEKPL